MKPFLHIKGQEEVIVATDAISTINLCHDGSMMIVLKGSGRNIHLDRYTGRELLRLLGSDLLVIEPQSET